MSLCKIFKDNEIDKNIQDENKQMKKKIKNFKKAYNELLEQHEDIQNKYITLLESKSESFDKYLEYQQKCDILSQDIKNINKENINIKNNMKSFKTTIGNFAPQLTRLTPTASKCKTIDDIMLVLLLFYCTDRELPLNSVQNACKRCKVTKDKLKKASNYLYDFYNIDTWEIDKKKEVINNE